MNQAALQKLLSIGLLGAGTGVSARALMGLRNLLSNPDPVQPTSSVPMSVPIPTLQMEDEEEKFASGPLSKAAFSLKDVFNVRPEGPTWWQPPAAVAAGGAGVYGGWKLIDSLLKKQQQREQKDELGDAQQEYEDVMQQQFQLAMQGKTSDFDGLDEIFDHLTAAMEKEAGWTSWPGSAIHGSIGAYLTALGLTAGAGGLAGYQWAKSKGKQKSMAQAIRRRSRMRSQPMPIYAYPSPTRVPPPKVVEEEEEAR